MPPLTAENSHFLRPGSKEAALVMLQSHRLLNMNIETNI